MKSLMKTGAALFATLAAVTLLMDASASAQQQDPAAATQMFMEGREAAKAGKYRLACERFADSQRLDPKVGTLLNLADCQAHQALLGRALRTYEEAVHLATETHDDRLNYALERRAKLAPMVPSVTLRVQSGLPEGTEVKLDGVLQDSAAIGTAIPVDPGRHLISVQIPNQPPRNSEVILGAGENKEVVIQTGHVGFETYSLIPDRAGAGTASAATGPVQPAPQQPGRTLAYVAGGIGAAGIVVAAVTGLMLVSKNSTINGNCDSSGSCQQQGWNAVEDARVLLKVNTASWIVGAVGLGTGTVLWFTTAAPDRSSAAPPAQSPATQVAVHLGGVF
jgi:hypothetical protein